MKKEKKTRRLLFLVRLKNVLIFALVSLLVVWIFRLVYGRFGSVSEFWSFMDGLVK